MKWKLIRRPWVFIYRKEIRTGSESLIRVLRSAKSVKVKLMVGSNPTQDRMQRSWYPAGIRRIGIPPPLNRPLWAVLQATPWHPFHNTHCHLCLCFSPTSLKKLHAINYKFLVWCIYSLHRTHSQRMGLPSNIILFTGLDRVAFSYVLEKVLNFSLGSNHTGSIISYI